MLLRVLNRELVETQIFIEAAFHTPDIEWDEYKASRRRYCRVVGGAVLVLALLALIGVLSGVAVLAGVACGLMLEVICVYFARHLARRHAIGSVLVSIAPLPGGNALMTLGFLWPRPGLPSAPVSLFLVSIGATLLGWFGVGPLLFSLANKLHPSVESIGSTISNRVPLEDPAALIDQTLLTERSGTDRSPGKYFRPEWRGPIMVAACTKFLHTCNTFTGPCSNRILHAVDFVLHSAMVIHPELLWSMEEFKCKVPVEGGEPIELKLPIIRVCESAGSPNMEGLRPKRCHSLPFTAFVHHASQPDPVTGDTLVDVDMMHTRRRAFLKLHGMESEGVRTDTALPPMGEAVEEMVRQRQQPLRSALAHSREDGARASSVVEPGESLWEGRSAFGGSMGQYNPMANGHEDELVAKKKVAENEAGTGDRCVV